MSDQITISKKEYEELQSAVSILQETVARVAELEMKLFELELKQNKKEELSITTEKPKKICLQDLKLNDNEDSEDSELEHYISNAVDLLLKYGKEVL